MKFETKAIRTQVGRSDEREHSVPIFATSGYVFDDAEQMRGLFAGEQEGNIYSRYTNPNCTEFEQKMAQMEDYEYAFATATGMAAIYATLMSILKAGDHVICSKAVFGSTFQLMTKFLPSHGIEASFVSATDLSTWEAQVKENTKVLLLETPSNPGLDVIDLELAGKFSKKHGLISIVDNCFATPYLQRPSEFGIDIVTHSATKFIDGQGRVMGGVICLNEEHKEFVKSFVRQTGPSLSPFNAWILSKSLETLAVRLDRHCESALKLAEHFEKSEELNWVKYPFLDSHPQSEIAKKQMKLGGGLFTFELKGGIERGKRFIDAIQWLSISANLGDTRTIITHPASTTHSKLTEQDRLSVGITDGMVRVSVGLEAAEDIISDIEQALEKSK